MEGPQVPISSPAQLAPPFGRPFSPTWTAVWLTTIMLGGIQALAARFYMNADGISYLNLSDILARGDWSGAVNGYWSPLYPWLLSLCERLIAPSGYWEAPMVHAVNLLLYLGSFAGFQFFLGQLSAFQRRRRTGERRNTAIIDFTRPVELLCAYSVFLWSALILIGTALATPDMLLAGIVFLIAGVTLKLRNDGPRLRSFAVVGILLGLAYLTKAVMFPIGLIIALTCGLGTGAPRVVLSRTLLTMAAFLAVSSPQILAVSRLTGHLSYGEAGTLAYARLVNKVPQWWIGTPPGSGRPTHPVQQIREQPGAYEFLSPQISFSYPFWDEPAYWADGIRAHFRLHDQASMTKTILYSYLGLLGYLLFACCILFFTRAGITGDAFFYLLIPGVGTFLLYALVHAEPRLLGAWSVVLFLAAVSALSFPRNLMRSVQAVLAAVALFKFAMVADQLTVPLRQVVKELSGQRAHHDQLEIASALGSLGLPRNAKVASIGRAFDGYWARLGGLQIAMEVPEEEAQHYWSATDSVKLAVQNQFAARGAKAIVANLVPEGGPGPDWIPLGNTGYFAIVMPPVISGRHP
jgi:hypothetical protein